MRIDVVTPPMKGHLHPNLGIAVLLAPHHDVRVVSTPESADDVAASGLRGTYVMAETSHLLAGILDLDESVGSSPRKLLAQFRQALHLQRLFRDDLAALWRDDVPDLAIVDYTIPAAGLLAQQRGVRWWTTHASPCVIEGRSGPPAYVGGWQPGDGVLGRARDGAGRAFVRGFKRVVHRMYRRPTAELGYLTPYRADGSETANSPERILAITPSEIEWERQLPDAVAWVGAVLYTPPSGVAGAGLELRAPAVLVTCGTQLAFHQQALVAATKRAAEALPDVDFVVSLGGAAGPSSSGPSGSGPSGSGRVRVVEWVDYERDLPRFDVVVHHGGSGVLAHTLAAGLPSVVIPVDYDQFDNAARLVSAGVAVRATPDSLPQALAGVLAGRAATRRLEVRRATARSIMGE